MNNQKAQPIIIDPYVETLTQIRDIGKRGKIEAPAYCLAKGQIDVSATFTGFCLNPHKLCSQLSPSQVWSETCVIFMISRNTDC